MTAERDAGRPDEAARAHAARIVAGDGDAREDVAPGAAVTPPDLLDRLLAARFRRAELVAHARIGRHHVFKTRFMGGATGATAIVQARWAEDPDGRWRVRDAAVARLEGALPAPSPGADEA